MNAAPGPGAGRPFDWRALDARPWLWSAVLLGLFGVVLLLPPATLFTEPGSHLVLHMALEFVSIAVAAMIFALAWNVHERAANSSHVLLAAGFLAVCLLDFAHTLSYPGMPDFFTPDDTEKAIFFWLCARLVAALVFLALPLLPPRHWPRSGQLGALLLALGVTALVLYLGLAWRDRLPRTFVPGEGLTPLKQGLEYTLAALYVLAAVLLWRRSRQERQIGLLWLAAACAVQALSEVLFSLYGNVSDLFNVVGHVYKALAYLMVYRGLFVEGIRAPYVALDAKRRELQDVLATLPQPVWQKDGEGRYLACNPAFARWLGLADAAAVAGRSDATLMGADQAAQWQQRERAVLESGSASTHEEWLQFGPQGERCLFEVCRTPMRDGAGAVVGLLGVAHDITARRASEERLQVSARVFGHAREGIMVTDARGTITEVNDAFSRITGYSREEVLGQNPRILSSGRQNQAYYGQMWSSLNRDGHWTGEVWNRRKNGEVYAELQTISAVRDASGQVHQYVSLFSDISSFKEHERKLEHIAHYDALTHLPNRVLLADRLHQAISQRRGLQLAVAFLDLDGFKQINDQYGHDVGDRLLLEVAQRLKHALREGDTLARLGGDEFVAVLIGLAEPTASVPLLARLLSAAAQPAQIDGLTLSVSASIGVTFYPQAEDVDGEQLLRQADQAMYQAKLAGKNRYHIFDAAQDRSVRGHHESVEHIRRALRQDEFVLYYQPKVNMRSGEVIGAEALIRWQHPQRGLLAPGVFLPVIEGHPLGMELGEWVIAAALRQLAAWQAEGFVTRVSVNVGALQLQQADFVDRLKALLDSHPEVRPAQLELEVLETSALEDVSGVSQVIEDCKRIGVHFALDDFGTGYSSLTYLKRLPVRTLKIDQSFVRDMLDNVEDQAILQGVIGLARVFHREVIAEGVETVAHGVRLLQLGCELAQGYGVARPMPASEFPHWTRGWHSDVAWQAVPYNTPQETRP